MSFVDLYPIVDLPRVGDVGIENRVIIPDITSPDATVVDMGILKSNISSYIIRPSPRLTWSYPISPLSYIECMDIKEIDTGKQYAMGITEKKVFKVLHLTRNHDDTTTCNEIILPNKVKGVKFVGDIIYCILDNGGIRIIENFELSDFKLNGEGELVHYKFSDDLLIEILRLKSGHYNYKLVSLNHSNTIEVNNKRVDYTPCKFQINGNFIYKLCLESKTVHKIQIDNFESKMSTKLPFLNTKTISLMVPAEDRLVISTNDMIYLVNSKFQTLNDTIPIKENQETYLNNTVEVKGNSKNSSNTVLFYLNLNMKKNKLLINLLNIYVGMNTLAENIGKGLDQSEPGLKELPSLYDEEIKPQSDLTDFFITIKKYWETNKVKDFESKLLKYFTNQSSTNEQIFNADTDRVINRDFLEKVVSLIFSIDGETNKVKPNKELPERLMVYLLTHKLFPINYTEGLLDSLKNKPRLLRQAIMTCPHISLKQLMNLLITINNEELLNDLLERIFNDFSNIDIIHELQSLSYLINHDNLVNKLITINNLNSWHLIQLLVDIIGLNNFNDELLNKLSTLINTKLQILDLNSSNLVLMNNLKHDSIKEQVPSYSIEKI